MFDEIPNWALTLLVLLGFLIIFSGINIGFVLLLLGGIISILAACFGILKE